MKFRLLVCVVSIILLVNCTDSHHRTTHLVSEKISNREERIEIIEKEVICFSLILDAEFDLFNVNGFSENRNLVSGASSWKYCYAVKVDTSNIDKWVEGMLLLKDSICETENVCYFIKVRKQNWDISKASDLEFYRKKATNSIALVSRERGIIIKSIVTL